MLILSIDTSGRAGSLSLGADTVASGDDASSECALLGTVALEAGEMEATILLKLESLLKDHGRTKRQLTGVVVVCGPGSFTGLRVGIACAKALVEALQIPLVAVTTLEAMAEAAEAAIGCRLQAAGKDNQPSANEILPKAYSLKPSACVGAVMDAGRGEFFVAVFENGKEINEGMYSEEDVKLMLARFQCHAVGVMDDKSRLVAGALAVLVEESLSRSAARMGWKRIMDGDVDDVETMDAHYVRKDGMLYAK